MDEKDAGPGRYDRDAVRHGREPERRELEGPFVGRLADAVESRPWFVLSVLAIGIFSLVIAIWLLVDHIFVFFALFFVGLIIGALMSMRALRDHEVGVVSGRWVGEKTRIFWSGRPVVLLGEHLDILSLARRSVDISVTDCVSQDKVAVRIDVVGTFSVPRREEAVRAVSQELKCDDGQMASRVRLTVAEQIRSLLSGISAHEVHGHSAELGPRVLARARPALLPLGLELHEVNVGAIRLPQRYLETLENATVLQTTANELAVQRQIDRDDAEQQRGLESAGRRARVDDDSYAEQQKLEITRGQNQLEAENTRLQLEIARGRNQLDAENARLQLEIARQKNQLEAENAQLQLKIKQLEAEHQLEMIETRMRLDRDHTQGMNQIASEKEQDQAKISRLRAEIDLYALQGRLSAETEHVRAIAMKEIIKHLPDIYSSRNQILTNLRTIYAGSDGSALPRMLETIKEMTPEVMPQIKGIIDAVLGGGDAVDRSGNQLGIPGRPAGTTLGTLTGQSFTDPARQPFPSSRPADGE